MITYHPNFRLWRSASCFCLLSCINRWCHWEGEKVGSNLIRFIIFQPSGILLHPILWALMWPSSLLHTPLDMFICLLSKIIYIYIYIYVWIVWRLICIHPMYYCGKKCREKLCKNWLLTLWGPHLQVLPNDAQLPKLQQWQFLGDDGISQRPGPNERCNISNGRNPTMMMMMMMMKLNRKFCLSVASGWTVLKDINSLALEFGWLCFPLILCTRINSNCYR